MLKISGGDGRCVEIWNVACFAATTGAAAGVKRSPIFTHRLLLLLSVLLLSRSAYTPRGPRPRPRLGRSLCASPACHKLFKRWQAASGFNQLQALRCAATDTMK